MNVVFLKKAVRTFSIKIHLGASRAISRVFPYIVFGFTFRAEAFVCIVEDLATKDAFRNGDVKHHSFEKFFKHIFMKKGH